MYLTNDLKEYKKGLKELNELQTSLINSFNTVVTNRRTLVNKNDINNIKQLENSIVIHTTLDINYHTLDKKLGHVLN